jgi:hypothetical protein
MESIRTNDRISSAQDLQDKVLRPLSDRWIQRIDSAEQSKQGFQKVADQCEKFFTGDTAFMWKSEFRNEFMPGLDVPGIQVTIAKAFELVAIFGPTLFWDYPVREVKSDRGIEPEMVAELLGDQLDPLLQEDERRHLTAKIRNQVMQMYLNWTQRQQPGNGLQREAELVITEALVKGRGCGWTQDYKFPGRDDAYTGTFYDSVDNLFIDPDCTDPELRTATWIARKHVTPIWEVERVFDLDKGSLSEYASKNSNEANARSSDDAHNQNTHDLIVWYEVWSRGGIGTLHKDADYNVGEKLDRQLGDFTYCCVAREVPFFLNAAPKKMFRAKPKAIKEMFAWRTANFGAKWEVWRDSRWPVELLDFYPVPNSAWPLAPMAPGLGELIAMNVLLTAYVEISWENRKQIVAVMKNAADDIKKAVTSGKSVEYVELSPIATQTIDQMVTFLERPQANPDILNALAMLSESFDKRTGLSEILYAMSSHQIRVSSDANNRQQNASIRPEKMSKNVAGWMGRVAGNEASLAAGLVTGESLNPLLGATGVLLWDQFVTSADTVQMMREMSFHVEATDMMRPNRERDLSNLNTISNRAIPMFEKYAELTGDSGPLNSFMESFGEAMEQDVSEWEMGPWQPQPDPQAQQMQMQAQQLEMQNVQADTTLKQAQAMQAGANAESKKSEPLMKQMEFQFEQAKVQAEMQLKMQEAQLNMQMKQAEATQGMEMKGSEHELALAMKAADHEVKTTHDQQSHISKLMFAGTDHEQRLEHTEEDHEQKIDFTKEENVLKLKLMRQEAAIRKTEAKKNDSSNKSDSK